MKFRYILVLLTALMTLACVTPDAQPLIDSTLAWKKMEDEEMVRHRQLLSVAKFDTDPVKNAEAKKAYSDALDVHAKTADGYAEATINWAKSVGEFNIAYINKTLDQMIAIYNKIKKELDL